MHRYTALATDRVRHWQGGGADDYGNAPEHSVSDGAGNPCRHCLEHVPEGAGMLILAHRPFEGLHPYAETGPIFLCAQACTRGGGDKIPEILTSSPDYLLKGYSPDERIVYGTGAVVPRDRIAAQADAIFADPRVAWIHVRSARNNCYQLRIDRA